MSLQIGSRAESAQFREEINNIPEDKNNFMRSISSCCFAAIRAERKCNFTIAQHNLQTQPNLEIGKSLFSLLSTFDIRWKISSYSKMMIEGLNFLKRHFTLCSHFCIGCRRSLQTFEQNGGNVCGMLDLHMVTL